VLFHYLYETYCLTTTSCGSYHDFPDSGLVITGKLLSPWFPVSKWKSSLRKLYDRQHILVNCYGSCVYIFSVCHSEALEFSPFLSCLSGARVVHVVHVLTWNYWSHRSLLLSRNHHSESFMMASASLFTAYGLSVSQMAKYIFRLSFRSTWVFSCLCGVRVVHVVNLYDVISCNIS
jgi:hypothetical protein